MLKPDPLVSSSSSSSSIQVAPHIKGSVPRFFSAFLYLSNTLMMYHRRMFCRPASRHDTKRKHATEYPSIKDASRCPVPDRAKHKGLPGGARGRAKRRVHRGPAGRGGRERAHRRIAECQPLEGSASAGPSGGSTCSGSTPGTACCSGPGCCSGRGCSACGGPAAERAGPERSEGERRKRKAVLHQGE